MRKIHPRRIVKDEFHHCRVGNRYATLCSECLEVHERRHSTKRLYRAERYEAADCVMCGAVSEVAEMEELLQVPPKPIADGEYGSPSKRSEWR